MTKAVISGDWLFFYVCDSSTDFFRTNLKGLALKGWVVF